MWVGMSKDMFKCDFSEHYLWRSGWLHRNLRMCNTRICARWREVCQYNRVWLSTRWAILFCKQSLNINLCQTIRMKSILLLFEPVCTKRMCNMARNHSNWFPLMHWLVLELVVIIRSTSSSNGVLIYLVPLSS